MSVLIKGVDMPKDCHECDSLGYSDIVGNPCVDGHYKERCPLVEMKDCCEKCKFLYPLKKFVNGDWEYSHVCLLFPFTEEKDEICYAMVIEHPEVQMCEMFYEVKE